MTSVVPGDQASLAESERISTGVVGLDDILHGGLDRDRLYLVEGKPGTGKTTLALQYLLEGPAEAKRVCTSRFPKANRSCG